MITHTSSLLTFEEQIYYALKEFVPNKIPAQDFDNIVLCGLGGSGIGGRIARGYFLQKATCPIEVYSDYFLPNYVGNKTLVVLSSYSGNTEETLEMFDIAKNKGCKIIGICSGGELADKLKSNNYPYFTVPQGYQPRMALGFSLSLNLLILGEIFGENMADKLQDCLAIYEEKSKLQSEANSVFKELISNKENPILVFCDEYYAGIATRFCQQIQENSKGQAFPFILPEANHNVTESIYGNLNSNILFLNSGSNSRTNKRFSFIEKLLSDNGNSVCTMPINGAELKELFRVIYVLDWVSIYLSEAKGVDNMKVDNIEQLKNFLKS
ncbi:MAG: SIS domain-containing protein [Bacteroidetes bacterium]|nr:SIS domain-containing protein [Bacteroidota bacterium]